MADGAAGSKSWLPSMVSAGVQQYLVAKQLASELPEALRSLGSDLGFVTGWEDDHRWTALGLADLPTAFVPPDDQPPEAWLDYVVDRARTRFSHAHYLIVGSGLRVRGRHLSQVASVHPPRMLEEFMASATLHNLVDVGA